MDKKMRKRRSTLHKDNPRTFDNLGKRKPKKSRNVARIGSIWTDSKFPLVRVTAARLKMKVNQVDWTVLWQDSLISVETCRTLMPHQRVNRFPGVSAFACKDLLAQNLNRLYNIFPSRYKIFPRTWCLPHDYANITAYAISYPKKTFIIKPARGTEGRGIYITKNLKLIKPHERMICQVYISKPFLIDGFKFDLRVYALISSINPLRLYVYNEGLTRFATKKYEEPSSGNMNDKFMHLTNYSVNRRSAFYVHDQKAGTKRSITTLNKWFVKNGYSVKLIWASIDDAIIKTTLVALPTLRRYYSECFPNHVASQACFQILGFDMMLDHRLKPFVLEVNHSPSMNTPTSLDAEVKSALLFDTFRLLNLKSDNRDSIAVSNEKLKKLRGHGDRPHRMYNNNEPDLIDPKLRALYLRAQYRWEQNHLGNYRRVYPNNNVKKYRSILEYLERLKWPTLVRLPNQISSGIGMNERHQTDRALVKAKEPLSKSFEMLDRIFHGLKTSGNNHQEGLEYGDNKRTGKTFHRALSIAANEREFVETDEAINQGREKVDSFQRDGLTDCSALNINVMRKYDFIDRILYRKIEESRTKVEKHCEREVGDARTSSHDSSSQEYGSAQSGFGDEIVRPS